MFIRNRYKYIMYIAIYISSRKIVLYSVKHIIYVYTKYIYISVNIYIYYMESFLLNAHMYTYIRGACTYAHMREP